MLSSRNSEPLLTIRKTSWSLKSTANLHSGRHVRTLGQVAEIAEVTVIDYFPVILLGDPIDFHGLGFINQIEQCRKGIAQADAATATVANIVNPLELLEAGIFVVEFRIVLP